LTASGISATSGTLAGQISGGGTLVKTGEGTLVVSALNETFTGRTEILGGTLQLGDGGALPATLGSLLDTTKAGAILNNGVLAFKFAPGTTGMTISNALSGTGSVEYLARRRLRRRGVRGEVQGQEREHRRHDTWARASASNWKATPTWGAAAAKLTPQRWHDRGRRRPGANTDEHRRHAHGGAGQRRRHVLDW
jgi:autotransporter-associated beta strand protein